MEAELIAYTGQDVDQEMQDTLRFARKIKKNTPDHIALLLLPGYNTREGVDPAYEEFFPNGKVLVAWKGDNTRKARVDLVRRILAQY